MRKWGVLGLVVLGCGFVLLTLIPAGPSLPKAAEDFVLPDIHGQVVRLSQLKGKVVFLNVWTTWCPPCRQEMPTMQTLYRQLQGEDFTVLAVSQDVDGHKTVVSYLSEGGYTFPVLLDVRGEVGRKYGVSGYPETFLIDRQGMIVHHHIGYNNWASPESVAAVRGLIQHGVWTPPPGADTPGEQLPLRPSRPER